MTLCYVLHEIPDIVDHCSLFCVITSIYPQINGEPCLPNFAPFPCPKWGRQWGKIGHSCGCTSFGIDSDKNVYDVDRGRFVRMNDDLFSLPPGDTERTKIINLEFIPIAVQ
jgi:hypothetical protein